MQANMLKIGFIALAATASMSASATLTTLNTTGMEANAVLTLSHDAMAGLALAQLTMTPGGYATVKSAVTDPNNEDMFPVGMPISYNMPITTFTADIKLLPPALTPIKGSSVGSSLNIVGPKGQMSLANFTLDFKTLQVLADVTTSAGTTKQFAVYSMKVTKPLKFNLTGGVSIDESVGNLLLTPGAITTFASALKLSQLEQNVLATIDFGTIDASIVPWFRKVPLKSSTAAAVPEPSTYALLGLGLAVAGVVARRRQAA